MVSSVRPVVSVYKPRIPYAHKILLPEDSVPLRQVHSHHTFQYHIKSIVFLLLVLYIPLKQTASQASNKNRCVVLTELSQTSHTLTESKISFMLVGSMLSSLFNGFHSNSFSVKPVSSHALYH